MNRLGGVSTKRALIIVGAVIVIGGFALALLSSTILGTQGTFNSAPAALEPQNQVIFPNLASSLSWVGGSVGGTPSDSTEVVSTVTMSTTATYTQQSTSTQSAANSSKSTLGTASGLIEFSSQVSIQSSSPQQAASAVVALAYSVGGYVAYQSTYSSSANVVIRVPASEYQLVLNKVEAVGTVVSLVSNSNDVSVQYTDLNATLASLRTEQGSLMRLLNESASINSTLAIENQLQGVNQQINDIESQILQTRTLVSYSTINVTISQSAQQTPLSMSLSATPKNGTSPLSVTFNAVVKGGAQPYVINYNFGDGTSTQGQIVIHTYYQSGDYKVTVTATDQNGTVAEAGTTIHVQAPSAQSGLGAFLGTVSGLFVNVVEGIIEVAVVVLPLVAVGAIVVIPLRRYSRTQKVKQSQ
jgi:hypothetical protein